MVRAPQAEITEEDVGHPVVIVLTRMQEPNMDRRDLIAGPSGQCPLERRGLDELRPRTDDGEDV
jgi:hypothetical protein